MENEATANRSGTDDPFDLDAYLQRIGYPGERKANLDTLGGIVLHHVTSLPFENLNSLLGRPVPLDLATLQEKFLRQGRGGYCFEQNALFGRALQALGFQVTYLASRVVWNQPEEVRPPRSHMLLKVDLEGKPYLADVGFGVMTPTGPLRLELETEQATPHEMFRILPWENVYLLQAKAAGEWKPLYRFDLVEQFPADYELYNWYVSTHPDSPFTRSLIASRADPGRRYTLINNELNTYPLDSSPERRLLTSVGELREALQEVFRISLPDTPELNPALGRVLEAH